MRYMKTDRSLLTYILLTIVTCGIYALVFMFVMISDINEMLAQDGKHTPNIFMVWLLSLVTCGIYSFGWYYKLGERLGDNCRVRGIHTSTNGANVLLWMILGSLFFGIGVFIGMYLIIDATNRLAVYHNLAVAQYAQQQQFANPMGQGGYYR